MQQYRVNYALLVGLLAGAVVVTGLTYVVWKFQIKRRSDVLIVEAQKAYEQGDFRHAVQFYQQYVSIQPRDYPQRAKYAEAFADLAEQYDATPEERNLAVRVIESTLRELPDEKALRKRVAKLYGKSRMWQDALQHLELTLDDAEAQALRANYLVQAGNLDEAIKYSYGLIGFNPDAPDGGTFDLESASSPHDPTVYANLAAILRQRDQEALAERVIDQMITANPNSAAAYMARGRFFVTDDQLERGRADIERAYQISPDDADVLLAIQELAVKEKNFDKAAEYIKKGKEAHPQDVRFYQTAAALAMEQADYKGALDQIKEGLLAVSGPSANNLLIYQVELQLRSADYEGVGATIREMKEASFREEICDWYEAQVLSTENKWFQVNQLLTRLRPWVENNPTLIIDSNSLNYLLGLSYEKLGQYELAAQAYDVVLQKNPLHDPARLGRLRIDAWRGQETTANDPLTQEINAQLAKPKAEQDWTKTQQLVDDLATQRDLDEVMKKLVWADVLLMRSEFAAARNLANELDRQAPNDSRIARLLLRAIRFDTAPGQGPQQALQMWERMQIEDSPAWRLEKADLLIAVNDERTVPELASLMTGIDQWTSLQKSQLWSGMADRYLALRMTEEARHCLELVAESQPDDLPTRMRLFAMALEANDDEATKAAQDAVLKLVGSRNDSNWLYTEARRRLALIRRGREGNESLGEIRRLIERAMVDRPEWHELHVLSAELELLAGNPALARRHLGRAKQLGRLTPAAVAQLIKLLASDGQIAQAAELLDELPESTRQPLLGPLYAELLITDKKVDEAVRVAKAQADANPESAQAQYRYAQLLARTSELPDVSPEKKKAALNDAMQILGKAVEIQPDYPEAWYSKVLFSAMSGDREAALKALRESQLAISDDNLQFILGKSYEALGSWFFAEPMYRAIYEAEPDNLDKVQQLAVFYIGPGYRQPDALAKATPLINKVLRDGAEGKISPNDSHLLWARRIGARLLAMTGDYQKLLDAEKLLRSNAREGSLMLEDKMEMAQILAPRPEPLSRSKAVGLLEEIAEVQPLGEEASFVLGNLYFRLGEWNNCRRHMVAAMTRFPNSVRLRQAFVSWSLSVGTRRALEDAAGYIEHLRRLAPQSPATFELIARHAIKSGRGNEVSAQLIRRLPRNDVDPKSISEEDATMFQLFASLLTELKEFDHAERLYRLLAARDSTKVFDLATFLGYHRNVEQCLELLEEQFNAGNVRDVLRVAVAVLRERRDDVGDKFDGRVDGWIERALQDNLGSTPLLLAKAEFRELQQDYQESVSIYRELLAREDVAGIQRAVMLNNLSFLVALSDPDGVIGDVDALKLADEAASIMGPTSDILDTRAVILTARKRYDEAIEDLNFAVTDNPTPAKYFHKAVAHFLAGQNRLAVEAWTKAEELGLSRESLNRLEHEQFQQIQAEIKKLRAGDVSVTRTEAAIR
jgi:tetratricopeptide (TPR) repeat protein